MKKLITVIKNWLYNYFIIGASHYKNSADLNIDTVYSYDHSVPVPGVMCWNNVWGFKDKDGFWYACVDMRVFGIRVQDIVVKCKSLDTYKLYLKLCESNAIINAVFQDPRLEAKKGDEVNTNFIFHFSKETKNFNIHNSTDRYAYEK